mgnify:CR=1 FL=1
MDKEQLLYQYFSNSLTPEQEVEFNALLSSDTEFKEQFNFEQSLQKVIQDKEGKALKDKLKGFEADIKKDTTPVIKLNFRKWAMAASIALIIGIGWLSYNKMGTNYDSLYNSNFEQYPNTVFAITRDDTTESLERKAFVAYETNDNAKALKLFKELKNKEASIHYIDFYIGQVYLRNNAPDKAISFFNTIIEHNGEFAPQAKWFLALSHVKLKDKEKAVDILKDIIEEGEYKKEEAKVLLSKLK